MSIRQLHKISSTDTLTKDPTFQVWEQLRDNTCSSLINTMVIHPDYCACIIVRILAMTMKCAEEGRLSAVTVRSILDTSWVTKATLHYGYKPDLPYQVSQYGFVYFEERDPWIPVLHHLAKGGLQRSMAYQVLSVYHDLCSSHEIRKVLGKSNADRSWVTSFKRYFGLLHGHRSFDPHPTDDRYLTLTGGDGSEGNKSSIGTQ